MYMYIKYDILPCKTVPARRWILIPEVKVALLVLLSRARTSDAKSNAELHIYQYNTTAVHCIFQLLLRGLASRALHAPHCSAME